VRRLATYRVYLGEICLGEVTTRRGRGLPPVEVAADASIVCHYAGGVRMEMTSRDFRVEEVDV